jgi:cobalt/nickel transport protein
MGRKFAFLAASCLSLFIISSPAPAHFGMLTADCPIVEDPDRAQINLQLRFWHPRENEGMNLEKPAAFGLRQGETSQDLLANLRSVQEKGHQTWQAAYTVKEAGDHIFYFTPQPYWEPAENCFIIHYTKLVVDGFDLQESWDQPVGLPMEIIPLTRPYGLYSGNSFTGQVRRDGKPLAGIEIEIEFYDPEQQKPASRDCLITQVVKSAENGCFTIALPWSGWWGMAALLRDDDNKTTYNGRSAATELGGVLWIHVDPQPEGQ